MHYLEQKDLWTTVLHCNHVGLSYIQMWLIAFKLSYRSDTIYDERFVLRLLASIMGHGSEVWSYLKRLSKIKEKKLNILSFLIKSRFGKLGWYMINFFKTRILAHLWFWLSYLLIFITANFNYRFFSYHFVSSWR